ncbi:alpha/beta hydrolase [Wenjunlia tyrosinilytica]|uniref:Tripeptidyl aminopeptidase n=1 Tax=Wenjunlia tyrosinilytica TaxID=1544741 RepID=A0A917ZE95_9ACTN|nr:alpha/beta hydrolase [Wenjunlia tyrosinilytica]GGO80314.1 tripeptidyl aminopeptidase [Wenjunlia tyrosinilytica]
MKRIAVLGVAGTLLAGAVAAAPAASAARGGDVPGGSAEAAGVKIAAAKAAAKGVDWALCPTDWGFPAPIQCGYVTVPVNYAKPDGEQIKIAVDMIKNTGSETQRQGALVYNPGGPGGSGMRFPTRVTNKNPLWTKASTAYDFVGFDPRGVGHSAPISCMDPQEFVKGPKKDPVPDNEADKLFQRKLAKDYAKGCKERSGALLPYMTTANTVRDLDVIRAALHEKKLNYLGVSYGTYIGGVYATLFPTHVRRMIVDSIVDPSRKKIWYEANLDQDVAFQVRWDDWKAWVAKHDSTFHIGDTSAKVETAWRNLRATAKANPIGGKVGPAELLGFFQRAPYYDSAWIPVADAWSKYVAGDPQPLIDNAAPDMSDTKGNIAAENGNAVYTAVECTDAKWPTSWKKWDRDNTELHKKYPFLTWSNAWMNLPCATWGVPQQTPVKVETRKGLPRIMLINGTRDAATPYSGALSLHKRLKDSLLITEKGAGSHGVTGLVNPCINDRVDTYLLTGKLDKGDVTCAAHPQPEPTAAAAKQSRRALADVPAVH